MNYAICERCGTKYSRNSEALFGGSPLQSDFSCKCPGCAGKVAEQEQRGKKILADDDHDIERQDSVGCKYQDRITSDDSNGLSGSSRGASSSSNGENSFWWDDGSGWTLLAAVSSWAVFPLIGLVLGGFVGVVVGLCGAFVVFFKK